MTDEEQKGLEAEWARLNLKLEKWAERSRAGRTWMVIGFVGSWAGDFMHLFQVTMAGLVLAGLAMLFGWAYVFPGWKKSMEEFGKVNEKLTGRVWRGVDNEI